MKYLITVVTALALLAVGAFAIKGAEAQECLTPAALIENLAPEAAQYNITPETYDTATTRKIVDEIAGKDFDGEFVVVVYRLEDKAFMFFFEKDGADFCFVARVVRPVQWLDGVLNG